ncbi:MAG: PD40 domain-containing protein [Bacteroidetes bacterium]|nr:PD40 domain-containing protein [Bacteroidota bacterium]
MKKKSLILFLILNFSKFIGQINPLIYEVADENLKDSALIYFNFAREKLSNNQYSEAAYYLEKSSLFAKPNAYINYLMGVSYCYDEANYLLALPNIKKASNVAQNIEDYNYFLALAYQRIDSTEKAIKIYYKELTRSNIHPDYKADLRLKINQCIQQEKYKNKKNNVIIKNIGKPINTDAAEYTPLINSADNYLVFTYRGERSLGAKKNKNIKLKKNNNEDFFEDIFFSTLINDSIWSNPQPIQNLNTTGHDAAVCLNSDATEMFIYRYNSTGKGDLLISEFDGINWSKPKLPKGLNSKEWDGSACFVPNSNKIIIASERPGGYGGKDLYMAERLNSTTWGNIRNLGPEVNSKKDEDAPFITPDGEILFFSSNNNASIGGYDIFRSDIKELQFSKPYNLGEPINTVNDDKFFVVSANGKHAYFSSLRKGGYGDQDIYTVEPGIPGKPVQLLQIEGLVTIDGKPAQANVEITANNNRKKYNSTVKNNKISGKFLTNLPVGFKYNLSVKTDKFPPMQIELNASKIDSFVTLNVYANFNTSDYENKINALIAEKKTIIENNRSKFDLNSFASKYGSYTTDSLLYKVQVGAFKMVENFSFNKAIGLPKIIRYTDDDYITRFTMGAYKTYNEAFELLKKVNTSNNVTDAFIISEYKGKKKFLYQLINEKIIN